MERGGGGAVGVAWLGERFEAAYRMRVGGERMFPIFSFLFLLR